MNDEELEKALIEALDWGEKIVITDLGSRFALSWIQAVWLYDHGDQSMVVLMIERDHEAMLLQENIKKFLIQVVNGKRKSVRPPNFRGDPADRLNLLLRAHYSSVFISELQSPDVSNWASNSSGGEIIEWISAISEVRKKWYENIRDQLGVGEATFRKNLADLRSRIKKYPAL
tara:strand:+ start:10334 stop:10852 length:519 start_codon:yes stop_codon:yes gene_type:complete